MGKKGGGGGVVEMSELKIMPIVSCFKMLSLSHSMG